ncbi:MAG: amidohydrolase, partial [Firmicutes bacterium]|nr:amidohydrolase [Bacillota bacterium]
MFRGTVEKYYPEMAAIREDLHRHPELSNQEFRTSTIVMEQLRSYGLDSVEQVAGTGVVGLLYGTGGGCCLAIRADMDALPVEEETGLPFASEIPGVMHACGHDIHTATLLTTARVLAENRDKFRGCVKFIFQAAEEKAPLG